MGHQSSGWRRWCVWKPVGENCIIGASRIWAKGAANGSIVITASTYGADVLSKIQKGVKGNLWRYGTHGRFFHDKLFQLRMAVSLLRTVLIDLIPLVAGISLSQVMTACYRSFTKCWPPTKSTQGRTFFDPEKIGMSLSNVQVKLVTNAVSYLCHKLGDNCGLDPLVEVWYNNLINEIAMRLTETEI